MSHQRCDNCPVRDEMARFPFKCVCGKRFTDQWEPLSIVRPAVRLAQPQERFLPVWQQDRIQCCAACPNRNGIRCGELIKRHRPGYLMHLRGIPNEGSNCPLGKWGSPPPLIAPVPPAAPLVGAERYSAVWVYWSGSAVGDELRYSVRSASQLTDVANLVVCGDAPDWFTGDTIDSPRTAEGDWAKWLDSIQKLRRIIDDPRVTESFLWLYDDTFFTGPVSIAELHTPCVSGSLRASETGNHWRQVRAATAAALESKGLPARDYSTHCPMVFEKSKLLQTIEEFECDTTPHVIESLYGNQHCDRFRSTQGLFRYTRAPDRQWRPAAAIENVGVFNRHAARVAAAMFPARSRWESP